MKWIIPIMVFTSLATGAHAQESLPAAYDTAQVPEHVSSQPVTTKTMSLRECMEYAISNSTQVRIQQSKTTMPDSTDATPFWAHLHHQSTETHMAITDGVDPLTLRQIHMSLRHH